MMEGLGFLNWIRRPQVCRGGDPRSPPRHAREGFHHGQGSYRRLLNVKHMAKDRASALHLCGTAWAARRASPAIEPPSRAVCLHIPETEEEGDQDHERS